MEANKAADIARQGGLLPDPEVVAAARRKRELKGYHGLVYNAFAQREDPVFQVPLTLNEACVPEQDIIGWTANYDSGSGQPSAADEDVPKPSAAAPERQHESFPEDSQTAACSGTACRVVTRNLSLLGACTFENQSEFPVRFTIHQKSGSTLRGTLAPKETTSLATPMGCIGADDFARIEADFE
jgi:hypothetical protein